MSNAYAVSVIVPVCNVECYLRECLESLAAQTLKDIQIICVDDGSTDDSLSILREFEKRDLRFEVITKPNAGYGHTMNVGLDHAKGEYIGILESDDFAEADMFESLYRMAKEADVDVVKTDFFYHLTDNDPKLDDLAYNMANCYCDEPFCPLDHREMFLMQPAIWSGLYRRSFLLEKEIRFLETPGASFQDTSFNYKVFASAERALLSRDAFLHYRIDNANSSVKSQKKIFCICEEYEEMWRFTRSNPVLMERLAGGLCFAQFGGYLWNLDRLSPSLQWGFYERFVSDFEKINADGLLAPEHFGEDAWSKLQEMLSDAAGYFAAHYGPRDVETTVLLYVDEIGSRSIERSIEAVLGGMNANDELLFVTHPNNLMKKSQYEAIREKDARFFYDEVLGCNTLMGLDVTRVRGKHLTLVGIEKTPPAIELEKLTDSLAAKLEWDGRCGKMRSIQLSSDGCPCVPPIIPLMLRWEKGRLDQPLDISERWRVSTLDDYRASLSMIKSCCSWCTALEESYDHSVASSVYRDALVPLWLSLKRQYEGFCYSDRIKLDGEDPDTLSVQFALESLPAESQEVNSCAPNISVIVPVYNAVRYIGECLETVFSQKGVSFEVVCVNDGSEDDSLKALQDQQLVHSNLKVISKLNGGAPSARNVGMSVARGEYVAFIDPDDFYPSDSTLAHIYNAAVEHQANVCGGSFSCLGPDGVLQTEFGGDSSAYAVDREGFRSFVDDAFDYGWIRFIYSKKFLVEHEIAFPSLRWYEDPVFFVNVMRYAKEYYLIPEITYCYRVDYKEPDWTVQKARDLLKGIYRNMAFAKEQRMKPLYTRLVNRLENDYLFAIEQNIDDEEVFYNMAKIQAELDSSLISFVGESGNQFHLLAPLKSLANGGRPTAVVRLAKKTESSRLYKSIQHVREKFN